MAPFDMSWTPELTNKLSTQIDGQLPDFIADDHPKFSQFLKSYYQFLEAGELQLTVNIDNVLLEINTATNLLNEDGTLIVTEVGSGSTGKFIDGETITGGTSYATATVLVEDLGHTTPRMFISSQQLFETGETVTGGTSGASGVVTRYRANPVQNIQQLLAYADIDNTIYDFIEEFRKSFMEGIPTKLANGINKRNLEKHIRELYRRKGTKEAAKLFMRILLDEESEVFYPNQYMMRVSDADWDKPTIIRCSIDGSSIADELLGQSITGQDSSATALVESLTVLTAAAGVSYVEFELSNITGTFQVDETVYGTSSVKDVRYNFIIRQINSDVSISNDGTLYSVGDSIDLDTSIILGSGDISAKVGEIQRGSVSDVAIDDAGTNYEIGDLVVFSDNNSEAGLIQPALAEVMVVHGNLIDETDSDTILQESGTTTSVELFSVALEEGTITAEEPYAVYGTDRLYSSTLGYYYPIYLTRYAAEDTVTVKANASTNGVTVASTTITLDGNSGTIAVGMRVRGNSISANDTVTVTVVASQTSITISSAQSILDDEVLVFASTPTEIREYVFQEYPGINFFSPVATTAFAQATYSATTYTLYGGNFNHRADQLYGESGNAASYTGTINTEVVLGDRVEMELGLTTTSPDRHHYADEGFILESGDGDITKINVTDVGSGYSKLPTLTVRSQYGASAKVLATTTDIGRLESINVINAGFNYDEEPNLELRANFIIKDITGTFAIGAALTSHTGTVRSYDSTTQVLEVSLTDSIGIQSESSGTTSNEGMLLEDSLTTNAYIDDNLIMNANLVYGENLVDEDGDRLLLDAIRATTDFMLLEDDQGELIMEHPNTEELAQTILEDGSGSLRSEPDTYGYDDDNIMGEFISQESGFRTDDAVYIYDLRQVKFILESAPDAILSTSAGDFIVIDADIEYEDNVVLDGTSAAGANAGEKINFNATDGSGTSDPSNLIVLEAGLTDDVNEKLLYETDESFTNLVLNGIDSTARHGTEKVFFEDVGIDFSAGTTSITTAVASGTIVHADVAKASFTLGTTAVKEGGYGGIESLISEELIRLQDSYYYQQFSYEIQTNAGGNSYINELKKAIHPAGFNVFAKVIQTSFVSMSVGTTGASLGTNDYDANTYSALLASTFSTLFSESMQRRLGVKTEENEDILLESSILQQDGDRFTLEDETVEDSGIIELETPENTYPDFEGIEITHGTGAGEFGSLITADDDRIISERAEAVSNKIVIDGTDEAHLPASQNDAGSGMTLEDESGVLIREVTGTDGVSFLTGEDTSVKYNLVDETDNANFVQVSGDLAAEVFLRSSIVTKLSATVNKTHNTSNGLVFLATTGIKSIAGDGIQLEMGTAEIGSRLLITGTADQSSEGKLQADNGDNFLLETESDVNLGQSVTINTFTEIANNNLVDETDGDNLILENPVGFHGGGKILGEDFNPESYTITDLVRESLVNISDDNTLDTIILEEQNLGSFKQEDGTTVVGTFGDDILLEDNSGFGVGGKLILERAFIALEDSVSTGETPFGSTGKTTLASFSMPSDIFVHTIGKLKLEENDEGDNILLNSGVEVLLENGTEEAAYAAQFNSPFANLQFGFSGTITFDSVVTWDALKV
jgi:hypothetical protein